MSTLIATEVTLENFMGRAAQMRQQGYRLVTLTCVDTGNGHDILYHFDKKYQMEHFRLRLAEGATLPSICSLYPAAMIVENEIKDHFGIAVSGLSIDFQGRLVLTEDAPRAPMSKRCGMDIDARIPAAPPATAPAVKGGAV